jgi:hypothetical protein
VNATPTINYGSIMAMRCIGINDDYTLSMPLQILNPFAADFDGDCLNILYIPNKAFWEAAMLCFNPRNSMMISKNDGRFNNQVNVFKDILINANGIINLARDNYSKEQLDRIYAVKAKYAG